MPSKANTLDNPGPASAEAARRGIRPDPAQIEALSALDALARDASAVPVRKPFFRFGRQPETSARRGVYLWGPPGRGKTFLMDCAHDAVSVPKVRLHFFEFFDDLFHDLHGRLRGKPDAVRNHVRERFSGCRWIAFDEFHVHDIADAMLLKAFLEAVLALPAHIVLTSNYPPTGLLDDSRFRERFRSSIDLLQSRFEVMELDGGADYRMRAWTETDLLIGSMGDAANAHLARLFRENEASNGGNGAIEPTIYRLRGRDLVCESVGERTIWVSFDSLCGTPRSDGDYLTLAKDFDALLISGITAAALRHPSVVQRFIWLVDVLYDRRIGLALSSERSVFDLLDGAAVNADTPRLVSRLREMASWGEEIRLRGAA